MAQWVRRARSGGGESVQIKWRQDGRWQTETFADPRRAVEFRTAVEVAGNAWPQGWAKGQGWVGLDAPVNGESRSPDLVHPSSDSDLAPSARRDVVLVPDRDPGPVAVPAPDPATVAEVAEGPDGYFQAQDKRVRRGKLKPYTLHRDRRAYDLHLRPAFGDLAYADLDDGHISDWIDRQLDDGASAKSIRNRHGLLFSIIKHGQKKLRLRADNPGELSELPELDTATSQARQIRFFQPGEWALFRSCIKADAHLLLDLHLATGLRWGEVSALRIEDISFTGERPQRQANLHIVRAWSRRSPEDTTPIRWNERENPSWVLGPPKNGQARWVVVTGEAAERLERVMAGREQNEYVFQTRHANPWRYPDFYTDRWKPARDLAARHGLTRHVTPHMLRHTAVVWSLAEGVRIEVISEMIGHSSLQMTYDIYGGLINLRDPVMAQAMSRAMLISGASVRPQVAAGEVSRPLRAGRRGESRRRAS